MLGHTSEKQKTVYISFTEWHFLQKKYGYDNNLLFIAKTNNI